MERLKLVLQYFQSNSESISNGICIILALVSVKLYTSFDFNCPCLPQYNKLYSLGVMIVPPIILFFLGVLVNRHTGVMMDEWMRPIGNRSKNPAVVKWVIYLLPIEHTDSSYHYSSAHSELKMLVTLKQLYQLFTIRVSVGRRNYCCSCLYHHRTANMEESLCSQAFICQHAQKLEELHKCKGCH